MDALEHEAARMRAAVDTSMEEMGLPPLSTDSDGNHVFRYGPASGSIRVVAQGDYSGVPEIHVNAVAVTGAPVTKALLEELNSINQTPTGARVFVRDGTVQVARIVDPAACNSLAIAAAMATVGRLAAQIGPALATVYGGETPHSYPMS
jgi:hypothetical protein